MPLRLADTIPKHGRYMPTIRTARYIPLGIQTAILIAFGGCMWALQTNSAVAAAELGGHQIAGKTVVKAAAPGKDTAAAKDTAASLKIKAPQAQPSAGFVSKSETATQPASMPVHSSDAQVTAEALELLLLDRQSYDLKTVGDTVVSLRRKVTDNPNKPELRLKLGTYLFLLGDPQGAATDLTAAATLNPADAVAHAQLAKVLEWMGDHNEALGQFRRAVEIAPNVAEIHLLFAESLFSGGSISEAINEFRRSVSIKPSAEALSGLSEALSSAQDPAGALKAARQAVSLDSGSSRAQVALSNALLKSGDKVNSLRIARQAMLLNPNSPDSHVAIGRCYLTSGDTDAALDEFKQAVGIDPLSPLAHNDLGFAYYGKGDIQSAVHEFRLALRINPRFIEARNNLEMAVHRLYTGNK